MVVLYRQQFRDPGLYPRFLFLRSAVRAVAVAAAMILVLHGATLAVCAPVGMITQCGCSAPVDAVKHFTAALTHHFFPSLKPL